MTRTMNIACVLGDHGFAVKDMNLDEQPIFPREPTMPDFQKWNRFHRGNFIWILGELVLMSKPDSTIQFEEAFAFIDELAKLTCVRWERRFEAVLPLHDLYLKLRRAMEEEIN